MKECLDKQQSQHLIDLGVPKEKASIKHIELTLEEYWVFNLTDLFEILPKEIELENISQLNILYRFGEWIVEYVHASWTTRIREELIDSLYELCVWCIENGYLKDSLASTK